ncbi:hypothetical protein CVT25_009188 [Psilocybe cyanescens]|uniref:Alkyl transferase n=1 Tax=Psilocybe cyanescens TaxID=93625 RepID=A0A409WWA6_PSICY|nr:hypothetical protein CVT25_009188 [Psilocybe cyanescens]
MYFVLLVMAVASRLSFINARPAVSVVFPQSLSDFWISTSPNADTLDFSARDASSQNLRTMSEIVWSCIVTVFACSWVSVHPNIPSPHDSDFVIFRRRIGLMFWAIIGPELLMIWAMRQWLQASNIAKIYEDHGWTKVHGHFLVMGGFMLYRNGVPTQTLSIEKFHKHLEAGSIDFPNITKEDIVDRSKGDLFSKVIVMVQVAWFAVQCIARRAQGLTITELEIVTLAFTTLNGAMYAFWWNKPLDVRYSVRVDFKSDPIPDAECPAITAHDPEPKSDSNPAAERQQEPQSETKTDAAVARPYARIVDEEHWVYMDILRASEAKNKQLRPEPVVEPTPFKTRLHMQISKTATSTRDALLRPFIMVGEYVKKEGLFSALFDAFVYWPIKNVLDGLGDIVESDESKKVATGAVRVPMFYAPMMVPGAVSWIRTGAAILGVVFGSIHMAAWSGSFATHSEQTAWRVASLIITIIPAIILLTNVLNYLLERASSDFEDGDKFSHSPFLRTMILRRGWVWLQNKIATKARNIILKILSTGPIPQHVAFVMDGNRRYARRNSKAVPEGHSDGFITLRKMLEVCMRLNVKCVSAYAFSIENFKRSEEEVSSLMALAEEKLLELCGHGDLLDQYGVRLNVIGNVKMLPESVQRAARKAEDMTRHNKRAIFNICMPYTSRDEMTTAVESCVRNSLLAGSKDAIITEKDIDRQMMTSLGGSPPLDILVRTSGVKRLSDYMLWQCCEDTQLQFSSTYWPDFGLFDFIPIILDFQLKAWSTSNL